MSQLVSATGWLVLTLVLVACGGDDKTSTGGASGIASPTAPAPAAPLPVPPGSHGYFAALSALPEMVHAYSLRDQGQLDQFSQGQGASRDVTYNPAGDTYPMAQDAAKVVLPPADSTIQQVRLPIETGPGKTLITWDAWWGEEFRTGRGGLGNHKTFQVGGDKYARDRYLEVRVRFARNSDRYIGAVNMRSYAVPGPNVTDREPIEPQIGQFDVLQNTWTRFWVEVDVHPGDYDLFSMWVADPTRGPVQLFNRLQFESAEGLTNFWIEYNGSGRRTGGPLTGYVRNVVVLHGLENVASILQRPE